MTVDDAIGYYTYRSFLDQPAGSPSDILWGDGELLLLISDEGAVSGTLAFDAGEARKNLMDVSGTVTGWAPLSLRFIGSGRAGSATADFEYEYDCRVAHEWETATPPQRASLVGTVRRNRDHGDAKAGATASFIAVKRDFVEPRSIPGVALIPEAVTMLGSRPHRLRHTVWHSLRADWHSPAMTDAVRTRLRALGWGLTDPPFRPDNRTLDLTNGAGEDFLYMHRRMIRMMHDLYDAAGKPRITGWQEIPGPSTPQFVYRESTDPADPDTTFFVLDPAASGVMAPPPSTEFMAQVGESPFLRFNKTARGYANLMRNMASNLRNPRVLSQLTLAAFGSLIEFTVHNWMHMRWATVARNPATGASEVRGDYDIDPRWDTAEHDWLGDFHSSHVNPVFWRLHGWVDDSIGAWEAAHAASHPGQVQRADVRGLPWFAPGPWVIKADPFDWPGASAGHDHGGGHAGHGDHGGHGGHVGDELATLEQVMAILKELAEPPTEAVVLRAGQRPRLTGFARMSLIGLDEGES